MTQTETETGTKDETENQSWAAAAFEVIGPVMAGFQIATVIAGTISVGAAARWVIDYWFPFTRNVWTWVLLQIPYEIDLSVAEKDALTAVVFFLPLGLYALVKGLQTGGDGSSSQRKVAAAVVGAAFLYLIGRQIIDDLGLLESANPADDLFKYLAVCTIGLLSAVFIHDDKSANNIKFLIITGGTLFVLFVFLDRVGPWRATAAVITIAALLAATNFAPKRLLQTLGVALAFLLTSVIFDLVLIAMDAIEGFDPNAAPA